MNYEGLPESLQDAARLYMENGVDPGSFLGACFENDLVGAFAAADMENTERMLDIVGWLYNECPLSARGPGMVKKWGALGGLKGVKASSEAGEDA